MGDTKEDILQAALRLFARDGYEATSVSAIASELGMTKGALYKHYQSKHDIFDSIVERMYRVDAERAKEYGVPEDTFDRTSSAYGNASVRRIQTFTEAQYRFWTEDEFACNFRKMLTLEQYRNPEMADLYQKCLASGVVSYVEDLFREMINDGTLAKGDPQQLALAYHAPLYLLMGMSDTASDREKLASLLEAHINDFMKAHIAKTKESDKR